MSAPLLEVRDLCVEFPTRHATLRGLDGVAFDIAAGEILGLVGESGAGKSLTGAAIIGLLEPPGRIRGGQILFDGQRIDDLPRDAMRRLRGQQIGAIFQDPLTSLNPLYTIGRQLSETLRAHAALTGAQTRERALYLLRETGVPGPEARLSQYPHELSGGLRQRVVIALALAGEPRLVIADEPTTALDVATQAQVLRLLRRVTHAHGASVMLITHDMGVVAETCDRVAVMYGGRIVEIGPVREVIDHPAHPYTAGLMASVPSLAHGGARLAQIAGTLPRLGEIPSGCPFHPRCPKASPRCVDERPELALVRRTRAACWWPIVEGRPA